MSTDYESACAAMLICQAAAALNSTGRRTTRLQQCYWQEMLLTAAITIALYEARHLLHICEDSASLSANWHLRDSSVTFISMWSGANGPGSYSQS
jgi:hypothetical protein